MNKINWEKVELGRLPDKAIAECYKVSRRRVCYERNKRNISPFKGYLLTQEGFHCRSVFEAMYDAYLHWKEYPHQHEVQIYDTGRIADFLVGSRFVEITGMIGFSKYEKRLDQKRQELESLGINVTWLTRKDVQNLYEDCPVQLHAAPTRKCKRCETHTHDLVRGLCRNCYMIQWHHENGSLKTCKWCKGEFTSTNKNAKYCCREHYVKSMELDWPSWEWIDRQRSHKSIRQIAIDIGVNPNTLYMRLRRRQERCNKS